jgi:NAD(P)H-dependent FMN reductase
MKILSVICSPRKPSHSLAIATVIEEAARQRGAEIDRLNLAETPLPIMDLGGHGDQQPFVDQVTERMLAAEAFIVVSPEYHGSMSGMAKNFFDHGYHEFSGKLFAIASATGGSQGVSCMTHMRATIQYCHGWTLPYQVGVREADFDADGQPMANFRDRLERLGRDLVVYGKALHGQFQTDLTDPKLAGESFAGWHAKALAS